MPSHLKVLATITILFVAGAITQVNLENQATLRGYAIGKLKQQESRLLHKQSLLQMELAKLTTKSHLTTMATQPSVILESKALFAAK